MLLALATPKLCERFSFARVSPFPLRTEGRPAGWGLRGRGAAHLCGLGLCWTRGPTGSASMEGTPASNRRWSKDSLELENDRSWGPQSSGPECRVALLGVGVGCGN